MDKGSVKYIVYSILDGLGFLLVFGIFVAMTATLLYRCFESKEEERKEEVNYYDGQSE